MYAPLGVPAPGGVSAFCALSATRETLRIPANPVNRVVSRLTRLAECTLVGMGKLDPDDPRPPYRQIADNLRSEIESGKLGPGAQLPALPALTSEYGVSIGTAKSALAVLRDAGLIVTRQGKGSYVRTRPDTSDGASSSALDQLRETVAELVDRVDALERKLADR